MSLEDEVTALRVAVERLTSTLERAIKLGGGVADESAAPQSSELWTVGDVMKYLKTSRSWVYSRVADGALPAMRAGGLLRFRQEAVKAWAASRASEQSVPGLKNPAR